MLPLLLSLLAAPSAALAGPTSAAAPQAPPTMSFAVDRMEVVTRVRPALPTTGALAEPVACRVAVSVDGAGEPSGVDVTDCPAAYMDSTQNAMQQWRWSAAPAATERTVSMTIRFPAARPVATPTPTPRETVRADRPDLDTVVCAADIQRNRRGRARGVEVVSCPAAYREAAEGAALALAEHPADPAGPEAPRLRDQRITLTFSVTDL